MNFKQKLLRSKIETFGIKDACMGSIFISYHGTTSMYISNYCYVALISKAFKDSVG